MKRTHTCGELTKKDDKKKAKKSEKAECQEKSDCCKSKCSGDKKDDKK